jgi:hypothetical protein
MDQSPASRASQYGADASRRCVIGFRTDQSARAPAPIKKDGRRLELVERGPGLGCRNADYRGGLEKIPVVGIMLACHAEPTGDVRLASPAATTHRGRRSQTVGRVSRTPPRYHAQRRAR